MVAYYNELDPYAAAWLRNLIGAGLIAPGNVDERDIRDVRPDDLRGYTQCHFFAGIGCWSYALRRVGWPDDRPVWTFSEPCQPFSAAGRRAGTADERYLRPYTHHLVRVCRPEQVFGEQVASKDGLAWLNTLQADMEGEGYAVGALDTCAAGFGAPHRRQRLFFVGTRGVEDDFGAGQRAPSRQCGQPRRRHASTSDAGASSGTSRLAFADDFQWRGESISARGDNGGRAAAGRVQGDGEPRSCGDLLGLADAGSGSVRYDGHWSLGGAPCDLPREVRKQRLRIDAAPSRDALLLGSERPGPTNGFWRDADWLFCRDDKWRPVRSGSFPLAHGAASRVGRLRAYGNAIVAEVAAGFISAFLESEADGHVDPGPDSLIGHNGGPSLDVLDLL